MGYKKIAEVLMDFDTLAGACGLYAGDMKCSSRSTMKDGDECQRWNCPLAFEPSLEDLKRLNPILYNEYKEGKDEKEQLDRGVPEDQIVPEGHNWVVQHSEPMDVDKKYVPLELV